MSNIEWDNGLVCFASGKQFVDYKNRLSSAVDGCLYSYSEILSKPDFQLNEPRIGDHIEKSELDTEQKYNDVVEVFKLFGIVCDSLSKYEGIKSGEFNFVCIRSTGSGKIGYSNVNGGLDVQRKLTYNQLMAIGKFKRMMNERESIKRQSEYCRCVKVDVSNSETISPCAGGFSVGYKCEMPTSDLVAGKSDIQKAIDKSRAELNGYSENDRFIIGESDEGLENAIPDSARKNPNDNIEITFNPSVNLEQDFKKHIKYIESDIYNAVNKSGPVVGPEVSADEKHKPIVAQVMIDLTERMEVGIKEYGEALRPHNGRDALQDAYEEALDLACYLKQAIIERDS